MLGKFGAWEAYSYEEAQGRVCYAMTHPLNPTGPSKQKKIKRGQVILQISHRPAEGTRNSVSYVAGLSLKDDSTAQLITDKNQSFTLSAEGDTAWSENADEDGAIVGALRGANTVTVKATGRKDALADSFSLKGSTAALNEISRACGY